MSIVSAAVSTFTRTMHSLGAKPEEDPAKIRKSATDFEAMLIDQMLRSAREAGGGLIADGSGDDQANSSLIELGEQQFAQALASSGGLGIAKMVVAGLMKHADR